MSTYVKSGSIVDLYLLGHKFSGFSIRKQEIGKNNSIEYGVLKYNSNENIHHKKRLGF